MFDILYSFQPFYFAMGLMIAMASLELLDSNIHRLMVREDS